MAEASTHCTCGPVPDEPHECDRRSLPPHPSASVDLGLEWHQWFAETHGLDTRDIARVYESVCLNCGGVVVMAELATEPAA